MIIHSKKRSFGKACDVSLFTLGTMRATESLDKMNYLIKSAHDAGINHLETAAAYGNAEKLIGESLKELEASENIFRKEWIITTKVKKALLIKLGLVHMAVINLLKMQLTAKYLVFAIFIYIF